MSFYVSAVRIRVDGGEIVSQKREMYLSRVTNLCLDLMHIFMHS